jgi:hypothetical protein
MSRSEHHGNHIDVHIDFRFYFYLNCAHKNHKPKFKLLYHKITLKYKPTRQYKQLPVPIIIQQGKTVHATSPLDTLEKHGPLIKTCELF